MRLALAWLACLGACAGHMTKSSPRATKQDAVDAARDVSSGKLAELDSHKGGESGGHAIDALHARNVSAFANFACFPNMKKVPRLGCHWDSRLPNAAFVATRDIAAGEELSYRRDESATSSSRRSASRVRCECGHQDCLKWV